MGAIFSRNLRAAAASVLGIVMAAGLVNGVATARGADRVPGSARLPEVLTMTYALVVTDHVPVYSSPSAAASGELPVRSLGAGYVWVSLSDSRPISRSGQAWYAINPGEYVRADRLAFFRPTAFRGLALAAQPDTPFAWMVYSVKPSPAPGEAPAKDAPLLTRYTRVTILEERWVGDLWWYRIGDGQWIEQRTICMVRTSPRPEGVGPDEKWIEVNLFEQTLAAYEGDRMVYATLVSSGLPQWRTESGLFRVRLKVRLGKMSGRDGLPDYYYLEDVPHAIYFNGLTALHGAYWHDRFGFPHSHGCVNLPPADAQWLFDWAAPQTSSGNWTLASDADPGTWVWVHD